MRISNTISKRSHSSIIDRAKVRRNSCITQGNIHIIALISSRTALQQRISEVFVRRFVFLRGGWQGRGKREHWAPASLTSRMSRGVSGARERPKFRSENSNPIMSITTSNWTPNLLNDVAKYKRRLSRHPPRARRHHLMIWLPYKLLSIYKVSKFQASSSELLAARCQKS